jgi:hypothetical protein
MKRISLILILILIASCSSVKKEKRDAFKGNIKKKTELRNLKIECSIEPDTPDLSGAFNSIFEIAARDSFRLKVYAPFGIEVARILASKNSFLAYNVFQSQAFRGKSSSNSLEKVANIKIEFDDLISFMRSDVPGDPKSYIFEKDLGDGRSLYRSKQKKNYLEFVTLDPDANLIQYQQQDSDGNTSLNVYFEDYKLWGDFTLAGKVTIKLPDQDSELVIDIDEYSFPVKLNDLSLDIPSSIEIQEID